MLGMSLLSFLVLTLIWAVVAVAYHNVIRRSGIFWLCHSGMRISARSAMKMCGRCWTEKRLRYPALLEFASTSVGMERKEGYHAKDCEEARPSR
jgi:hypothetical protein